jgi:hypothetical protein
MKAATVELHKRDEALITKEHRLCLFLTWALCFVAAFNPHDQKAYG